MVQSVIFNLLNLNQLRLDKHICILTYMCTCKSLLIWRDRQDGEDDLHCMR